MDINQQAIVCEELLRTDYNQFCSDCPSKIPRWASINFGVFICIRCSGVHRQMGVHISKVKSVNLDKWPAGKIELFQNVHNQLINSYWEKNLPKGYRKPDSNASNREVTDFMENKYVKKKWANTDEWSHDPAWLYENKPKKFLKYVKYWQENFNQGAKESAAAKKKAEDSSDDEWITSKPVAKPGSKKQAPTKKMGAPPSNQNKTATQAPDLLSFDQSPSKNAQQPAAAASGNLMDMLGGGAPASQNSGANQISFPAGNDDGGFGDFQGNSTAPVNMQNGTNPQNMTQQTINIQNLYQMYNSNAHSANDKYSALDSMMGPTNNMQGQGSLIQGFGQTQPQQQQQQQPQKQPFQPMVGNMPGFQQNNNQFGAANSFGGMQGNNMMGQQQQPGMGAASGFGQAGQQPFGGMQQQQQQQQKQGFQPNAFGQGFNNNPMPGGMNQGGGMGGAMGGMGGAMGGGMGGAKPAMGGFGQNSNQMQFQQTQVPSYSSTPNQAAPQQPGGFGGFQSAGFGQNQQQQPSSGSFGSFQSAPQTQPPNVYANGLVDLSNLAGQQQQQQPGNNSGFAFSQSPSINMGPPAGGNGANRWNSDNFGNKSQGGPTGPNWGTQGQQQQKSNAFDGLVKF